MKVIPFYFFIASCIISTTGFAQQEAKAIEQEIIEQIWKPFKNSYEARNAEAFKSIHTDDMLRITDQGILTGPEYKENIDSWKALPDGNEITIDFAMENSNVREELAYQIGYYRVTFKKKDGAPETYFGQFHVVLKKADGIWKIAQDFDTAIVNEMPVDAVFFEKAELLDLTH
ncbi:ketosteroid isomerase-like protein [Ulvibacter sp. MAR_2010_11]|uniref:YybH family protein n=1 Tax=Ulvibacter sp. MAR_2010_11 TaxID=1250229 RepID=UPI000C2B6B41|nr:nuclear transport factor 2 family protein [Ulvibacter sp. MAR_2010_11]PKA84404.1 ketosteroid isomerase-like protein [Ulvibacter sp. MAR_2010_11]